MTATEPRKQYYIKVDGKDVLVREFNEDPNRSPLQCRGPVISIPSLRDYLAKLGYGDEVLQKLVLETPKLAA